MNVYSLFDRKLRQYGQLVLERNDFGVQRSLHDGVLAQPESLLGKHPEDFDLYQLGEFDPESGLLQDGPIPRLVCNVLDIVMTPPKLSREG